MTSETAATAETAATTPRSIFKDSAVLGWAVARGVSDLGDVVWFVAVAYTAATLGSPALAGAVLACAAVPRAVFMLIGGAITDRVDARRLMIITDLARVTVLIAALIVVEAQGVSAALLIAVGVAFGVADALYSPASGAFPRQIVPTEELPRLAGLRQLIGRIATVGGGPLGLLLVSIGGLGLAIAADLVSFVVIAAVLLVVKARWPRERSRGRSVFGDVGAGLKYLGRTPRVRDLVIALSGLNVFGGPVLSVGIALRTTEAGWSPNQLGVLTGCIGAGAVVGTLIALRWRTARPVLFGLALMFIQASAVAAVGLFNYPGEVAGMLVVGVTAGLASPMLAGSVQAVVDEAYLGRTLAVLGLADSGLMPVALAGFGVLAGSAGLAVACATFGLAFAVMMVFSITRPHLADINARFSTGHN